MIGKMRLLLLFVIVIQLWFVKSDDTEKHKKFVSEKMKDKPVTDLPGVGNAVGEELKKIGFDQAVHVLGKFLLLRMDKGKFTEWMKKNTKTNIDHATACFNALKEWCDDYI